MFLSKTNIIRPLLQNFKKEGKLLSLRSQKYYRICLEKKNQLDATECFTALVICPTCFGHFYAHHQELETICVLLPPMVCSACLLVVGVRCRAAGYLSRKRYVARLQSCNIPILDDGHRSARKMLSI